MTRFKFNEVVNVTVAAVRVVGEHDQTGALTVRDEHGTDYPMPPQAAVTRVAPAEWPPRPGDLWRDRHGSLWFAVDVHDIDETDAHDIDETDAPEIVMVLAYEDCRKASEELSQHAGPLTLVHREDEQAETSPYAHLIGKLIAVRLTDRPGVTGVLADAKPHGVTVLVDHPISGVMCRDVRAEDIAGVDVLDEQAGGDQS